MFGLMRGAVVGSVYFDDKAMREADEIEEIAVERGLATEMMAFLAEGSEEFP